jgi:RimJ/RimL family protein N-acetyltransferase
MAARAISADELAAFADFSADADRCDRVAAYLDRLWTSGASRPDWCLVCERDGGIVGRLAWWGMPGSEKPSVVDFLDVAPRGDEDAVVRELLDASVASLQLAGQSLAAIVDEPSPLYPEPRRVITLLNRYGFQLERVTARWKWTAGSVVPRTFLRLTFHALDDVGRERFVAALGRVLVGTLDRALRGSSRDLTESEVAGEHWEQLAALEHEPGWYQLAFDEAGALVGLIAPARNADGRPIIAFVGVVPEQRGRGYVDELLAKATEILVATDSTIIHADADIENEPMLAAFRRGGYREFARRTELVLAP